MKIGVLEAYISRCEEHLDKTGSRSTEVESYLVQYLLTRICAEYEGRIRTLVECRCSRMRDQHMKSFSIQGARDCCKRFSISEIKGILGRFGPDYKAAFDGSVLNKPAHVAWDNIYNNRHAVAHGAGAQMTFTDLRRDYASSLEVLDAIAAALKLRPSEIKSLV